MVQHINPSDSKPFQFLDITPDSTLDLHTLTISHLCLLSSLHKSLTTGGVTYGGMPGIMTVYGDIYNLFFMMSFALGF